MLPPIEEKYYCRDGHRYLVKTTKSVQVFETSGHKPISSPFEPSPVLEKAQLTDDGSFVLTSSLKGTNHILEVWDPQTGRSVSQRVTAKAPFSGAALNLRGDLIAVYGANQAQIYNARTGAAILNHLVASNDITSLLFSPRGDLVVTISGTVQVWNSRTAEPLYEPMTLPVSVGYAEFSHDGKILVTCSSDQLLTKCSAQLWDITTGRPFGDPLRHGDGVLSASFAPVGNFIATASEDFTAKIWDIRTGAQLGWPLRHDDKVEQVAWSPRGEWVATASIDHTARIWDPQTGNPLTPPLTHLHGLWNVKFLPDGVHLVSGYYDGRTFNWRLHTDLRPPAEITELAELWSGGDFISPVSPRKGPTQTLKGLWEQFRSKYQRDFVTSEEDIVKWHEFQVEQSKMEKEWGAAAFHVKYLLKRRPGDKSLEDELATIEEQQKKQN